ncbi:MAG: hypothetical protein ACP5N9_03660 [Candidatus Bilamarchaeum sp.]|jgi:hypothetical protein
MSIIEKQQRAARLRSKREAKRPKPVFVAKPHGLGREKSSFNLSPSAARMAEFVSALRADDIPRVVSAARELSLKEIRSKPSVLSELSRFLYRTICSPDGTDLTGYEKLVKSSHLPQFLRGEIEKHATTSGVLALRQRMPDDVLGKIIFHLNAYQNPEEPITRDRDVWGIARRSATPIEVCVTSSGLILAQHRNPDYLYTNSPTKSSSPPLISPDALVAKLAKKDMEKQV